MNETTTLSKARRGIKDDSSLHKLYWEIRREREAMGLPPDDDSFDPHKVIAEWHREQGITPPWARSLRKKVSPQKTKRQIRELSILVAPSRAHGYWVYCPAVNGKRMHGETVTEAQEKMTAYLADYLGKLAAQGKPLPGTGTRIKKVKIAAPPFE